MKAKKSKAAAVLLVIAALFLIYGIYAVINAVNYVNTYTTASTITTMGSIHYIVTSSMAYFGFASILIAASLILKNQANISGNSENPSVVRKDSIPPVTRLKIQRCSKKHQMQIHLPFLNHNLKKSIMKLRPQQAVSLTTNQ